MASAEILTARRFYLGDIDAVLTCVYPETRFRNTQSYENVLQIDSSNVFIQFPILKRKIICATKNDLSDVLENIHQIGKRGKAQVLETK